ncbi:hypothetical protein [Kitasatospora sp. NPDC094011]|uniref:hypothetical protein n=1 Tax=Kitasatospora sp. NPDC094011 TaxID=3364090 RepID=UPI00382E5A0E
MLDKALEPINTGLGKVAAAKTTFELTTALGAVTSDSGRAIRTLKAADTPAEVVATRTDLVAALDTLASEASAISADIWKKKLCAVGAGQARLGGGQGMPGLSAALNTLTAAGYRTVLTVPELPKPQPQPRTLDNGTMIREGGKNGRGKVKINNDGAADAVFTLAMNGKSVASVYAAKGQETGIEGIEDGSYDFYLTTGVDWDSEARQFTQDCSSVKYQEKYAFESAGTIWRIDLASGDKKDLAHVDGQTVNSAPQP